MINHQNLNAEYGSGIEIYLDIWAYNPRGELWTKGGVPADESEPGSEDPSSGDDYDTNGDE